jgi:DNA topoisomerase-3
MSRDDFEDLLGGMARAGLVRLDDAVFEKGGRQIPYRTVKLTGAGIAVDAQTPLDLVMKEREPAPIPRRRKKKTPASGVLASPISSGPQGDSNQGPVRPHLATASKKPIRPPGARPDVEVEEALRAWRLGEARRLGIPAFRIFTDRALSGLVTLRPSTSSEMLGVPGIGLRIAERYGAEICHILHPAGQVR